MLDFDWLNAESLAIVGLISVVTFLLTLLVVPFIVIRMPDDYFIDRRHTGRWTHFHPVFRYILIALKNLLGLVLLIIGILMLVLPGQGLLTIFFGIALMDFPGKFAIEHRLISYPPILNSINWIRKKANRKPLIIGPRL